MPSGHRQSDVPSKYQPLFDFLAQTTGDEVTLTYHEVMTLIDGSLPETAILHTAWWTNKRTLHVQAWRALGWRAHASAAHRRVVFTRDAEEPVSVTNHEALTLRPGDRIRQRPHPGSGLPASFVVSRVTVTGEGLVIVTTTGLHFAPWEVERDFRGHG